MDDDACVGNVNEPVRSAESCEQVSWGIIAECSIPSYSHRHVKECGRRDRDECGLFHLFIFCRGASNGVLQKKNVRHR
jgi:hypothetical protein